MARLFIGSFVSQQDHDRLGGLQQQNQELDELWKRKVRWVSADKLHMTWIFLGTVSSELIQPIGDMLNSLVSGELKKCADKAPMQLTFDHAEIWPDSRRARQVVLRPSTVDERIIKLSKVLRAGLLEFYFEQSQKEEVRSFKPHLTLLRLERRQEPQKFGRAPAARVKLSDLTGVEPALPVVLNLDKISLIESHMGKNSGYQILQEVPMVFAR